MSEYPRNPEDCPEFMEIVDEMMVALEEHLPDESAPRDEYLRGQMLLQETRRKAMGFPYIVYFQRPTSDHVERTRLEIMDTVQRAVKELQRNRGETSS